MAEEHHNKAPECETESNVGGKGAVETKDRGLFDFLGNKKDAEEKPQGEAIATEFHEKVKIEESTKVDVEEDGEEKKKHSLLEKLHQSDSSSSSSSEEEGEGEEKRKKKKKKEKKKEGEVKYEIPVETVDEPVVQVEAEPEKKGFLEKIKEKLPGQHKKTEEIPPPPPPPPPPTAECFAGEPHEVGAAAADTKEKKGILEKIKEKLPGYHSKTEEEKEKEKEKECASH